MTSTSKAYIPCPLMMSNERRSHASTPVVVIKDNLKQTETKGYLLQNKKKIISTNHKRLTHIRDRLGKTMPLELNVLNKQTNK